MFYAVSRTGTAGVGRPISFRVARDGNLENRENLEYTKKMNYSYHKTFSIFVTDTTTHKIRVQKRIEMRDINLTNVSSNPTVDGINLWKQ